MQKLSQNKALVRLSHQYAVGEDPVLSKPATVDMASLFGSLDVEDVTELTLTGGMPKAHVRPSLFNGRSPVNRVQEG